MSSTGKNADGGDELVLMTLGDGDFTWSLDWARHLKTWTTVKAARTTQHQQQRRSFLLVATGIDSAIDLERKYRDSAFVLRELKRLNDGGIGDDKLSFRVQVRHGVNAIVRSNHDDGAGDDQRDHGGDTASSVATAADITTKTTHIPKAHVVIFNHPHLGTEDANLHSRFLCHLFDSVNRVWLSSSDQCGRDGGGVFYLTLVKGQFDRWHCADAASRHGMELLDRYSFVANPNSVMQDNTCYYEHRRHQSGKSFASRTCGSETFAFVRSVDKPSIRLSLLSHLPNLLPWFEKKTTGESTSFTCPHCHKAFREERSVKNHIQSKHGGNGKRKRSDKDAEKLITCQYCESTDYSNAGQQQLQQRTFDDSQALEDHIRAKHKAIHANVRPDWSHGVAKTSSEKDAKPLPTPTTGSCNVCGETFRSEREAEEHWKAFVPSLSPAAAASRTFYCQFCAKQFPQKRSQLQHENFCSARPAS